jgi:phenazine biosynthesis protein phzE
MFKNHSDVKAILYDRNKFIAKFWFAEPNARIQFEPSLKNKKIMIIDAEDTFTRMLAQQLSALGLHVEIRKSTEFDVLENTSDLMLMGPGPGDPRNMSDLRIAKLHTGLVHMLNTKKPFLAVCLSHQILSHILGLELVRKKIPAQGVQREINFFGTNERVGCYNTYTAICNATQAEYFKSIAIEICRDPKSNEVHGIRGTHFCSVQFHPESLLTCNGIHILGSSLKRILPP